MMGFPGDQGRESGKLDIVLTDKSVVSVSANNLVVYNQKPL